MIDDRMSAAKEAAENANDRFERLASEFYRDTGILAPGKDIPAAIGNSLQIEARQYIFEAWGKGRKRERAAYAPKLEEIGKALRSLHYVTDEDAVIVNDALAAIDRLMKGE